MATILLKRGLATDLEQLTLKEGEPAITFNADKSTAQLYIGGAEGKKILVTADVAAAVATALETANRYADEKIAEKITELINGAPTELDTLKELADELQKNEGLMETLQAAIGNKVDKEAGKGLSEANFTNEEKEKLEGIAAGANNYTHPAKHEPEIIAEDETHRFVTDAEKDEWSGKLGADDTIDGGSY